MYIGGRPPQQAKLIVGCQLTLARWYHRTASLRSFSNSSTVPRLVVPVMVEGHQCHRVGHAHRRLLLGKRFLATSPNGRFAEGAAAISGKLLSRIEVHGKNLFYFFGGSPASNSNGTTAGQEPQVPLLQPIDEDPLQPGALDSDSEDARLATSRAAAAAEAAAEAPKTPAGRSRKATAAAAGVGGPGSPSTPSKALLASLGSAAVATLTNSGGAAALSRGSPSILAASPAAAPTTPAAVTPGGNPAAPPGPGAASASAADEAEAPSAAAAAEDVVVVHIHFGMSGAFRTSSLPGPEPTPTTRLRLVHEATGLMAHLSAMTVAHGGLELYKDKVSKLGPDPLRPTDDAERFWARVQGSKKSIGLLLMDQTAIAGVGNIYRAEILYKTGLHPEQPGHTVDRATFEVLWGHCVDLLHRGFTSGSILTVDPEDAILLGKPWTRRYIYNQRQCGRCKGPVKVWEMATRTVYCCDTCQPLRLPPQADTDAAATPSSTGGSSKRGSKSRSRGTPPAAVLEQDPAAVAAQLLHPSRLKSMAAAKVAKEFVSHCAPDDPSDLQPSKMTCQQLRSHLKQLNMDTQGNKPQLVARLEAAQHWMAAEDEGDTPAAAAAAAAGAGSGGVAMAADSETELLVGLDDSSSESGDEVDRAEEALAQQLSVPAAKRQRTSTSATQQSKEQPGRSSRGRRAAPGAADEVVSARVAAAEKAAAGENRAVEHVALQADEWTDQLMFGSNTGSEQQQQQQQLKQQAVDVAAGAVRGSGTPAPARPRRTRRS